MSDLNLVPYSKGYCVVNMELGSDIITAHPISVFPMVDGELQDGMQPYEADIPDSFGKKQKVAVNTTVSIKAKWLCRDANLMTPPNIRRGATVQLYRESNTDYFYWETVTNTQNYQKLETKIYGFSNTQKENEKPSFENTWTQGVSTHEKHVNLIHTTKSDGEKWDYDVNVDAKKGEVNIQDDIGNFVKINSGNKTVRLETAEGAFVLIDKRDVTISCDNLTMIANKSVTTRTIKHTHHGDMSIVGLLEVSIDAVIKGKSFLGHRHRETGDGGGTTLPPS